MLIGYAIHILVGFGLLSLPLMHRSTDATLLDHFFTASSAVSTTGLRNGAPSRSRAFTSVGNVSDGTTTVVKTDSPGRRGGRAVTGASRARGNPSWKSVQGAFDCERMVGRTLNQAPANGTALCFRVVSFVSAKHEHHEKPGNRHRRRSSLWAWR